MFSSASTINNPQTVLFVVEDNSLLFKGIDPETTKARFDFYKSLPIKRVLTNKLHLNNHEFLNFQHNLLEFSFSL